MHHLHIPLRAKTLSLVATTLGILWGEPEAGAKTSIEDASVELADQAVQKNPGIAAIKSRMRALEERVRGASAWIDPKVAVEYSNIPIDSGTLGDHGMSGLQLKLQQTFTFPGKTSLREDVVAGEERQQRQLLAEREVQLRAAVKRTYYRLTLTRHLEKVTREHIKLVEQFIDVVRVKYEVGKVQQQDLLRLQVLASKLKDDLKRFERDVRALSATINATLHRSTSTLIETPQRIKAAPPLLTARQLEARADAKRPLLRLYLEQSRTRRAAAARSAKERYPDITAWVGYRVRVKAGADAGTDFFSVGLSLPLPLFSDRRWGSQKRRHEALSEAARNQRMAEVDRIRGAIAGHLASWERAAQEATSYRKDLMPRAHRILDATFAAYQVDRADFASLFQAEMQLLTFERTIRHAEAKAALSRVEIEALTGDELHEGRKQ